MIISQDPGRVDNIIRNLAECYSRIVRGTYIFGVALVKINTYYRYEDYGKPCPPKTFFTKTPTQPLAGGYYDYTTKRMFFLTKKVFSAYNTRYFKFIFDRLPLTPYKQFSSMSFTEEDLIEFGIDGGIVKQPDTKRKSR